MIRVARVPMNCTSDKMTHISVARGIHAAAFDARSLHCDTDQHASDLRDYMVQTREIHEANSSLTDLEHREEPNKRRGSHCIGPGLEGESCRVLLSVLVDIAQAQSFIIPHCITCVIPCLSREKIFFSCQLEEVLYLSANIGCWGAPVGSSTGAFIDAEHSQAAPTSSMVRHWCQVQSRIIVKFRVLVFSSRCGELTSSTRVGCLLS